MTAAGRPVGRRAIRAAACVVAVLLAACAGRQASIESAGTAERGAPTTHRQVDPAQQPIPDGVPLTAVAWPREAVADTTTATADRLTDGDPTGAPFEIADDVRRPWSFVFRVEDGPRRVAAVGIGAPPGGAGVGEFTVLTHPSGVELTRAAYPLFIEGAIRRGHGARPASSQLHIAVLPEPVDTHYVWLRILGAADGESTPVLNEVYAWSQDDLERLREGVGTARLEISRATLSDVDIGPYRGRDMMGFPDLSESRYGDDGADAVLETTGDDEPEGSGEPAPRPDRGGAGDGGGRMQ